MLPRQSLIGILLLGTASMAAAQPKFVINDSGVAVSNGQMGSFTIEAPVLNVAKGAEKPVYTVKSATEAEAVYASGLKLAFTVKADELSMHFTGGTAEAKSLKFSMMIPMKFKEGGRFAFDKAALRPFPVDKGEQHVQHGNAQTFTVIDPSELGFTITTPGGYQGVQDNRAFNWAIFSYHYQFDIGGKKEGYFNFGLKPLDGAAAGAKAADVATVAKPISDKYGQSVRKDFPGKVKSDEELKADGAKQREEIAAFKPDPRYDTHGGLAGSGAEHNLQKTGFFHIEKIGDRQVLVSPEGNLFFQLGVCGIARTDDDTTVKGREKVYEWLAPTDGDFKSAWRDGKPDSGVMSFYVANWVRKFEKPWTLNEWSGQVVTRLKSWGFNSAGAFSANTEAMKEAKFPVVSFLPLGKGDGAQTLPDKIGAAEILDPFVPGTEEVLEKRFAKGVADRANDPTLIGYFLGNEQHFELLPKLVPTYKASKVSAKGRLVQMLEEKYKDIAAFNTAWNPATPFADFESMKEAPLFIRTDAGNADMQAFYQLYLDTYYSMVRRVFKKYDPNHLLIGSRWTPGTANNKDAVTIGSKYLDVISINYYGYVIEHAFLNKVYEWSGGKPMIFSEWYYSTTSHGLGAMVEVRDEAERGKAYRNYIEQSAALPYVVGSQWFIYTDQALTGRFFEGFHGEGNNTGFVDVTDRPYTELVAAAKETHARIYDVKLGKTPPFSFDDPRFNGKGKRNSSKTVQIPKALPGMKPDGTTTNWPGRPAEPIESSRIVLGSPNPAFRGDYRTCWDETNLYFHIQVKDPTPLKNNKTGKHLWSADGVELFIGAKDLTQGGNMTFSDRQILIGAAEKPSIYIVDHAEDAAKCSVVAIKDVSGDGYVLQVTIPWSILGVEPKSGTEFLFDVMIDNSDDGDARKQQLAWNGSSQNSSDRGSWGRARIGDN